MLDIAKPKNPLFVLRSRARTTRPIRPCKNCFKVGIGALFGHCSSCGFSSSFASLGRFYEFERSPCAPGPATTRRGPGMLVTNAWLGLASKLVLWLGLYAHLTARTTVSKERSQVGIGSRTRTGRNFNYVILHEIRPSLSYGVKTIQYRLYYIG